MTMLALTPEQFSTAAVAWLGAIVIVGTALGAAIVKLQPLIENVSALLVKVTDMSKRIDRQGDRIDTHIATQSTPTPVVVVPSTTPNVPTPVEVTNQPLSVKES